MRMFEDNRAEYRELLSLMRVTSQNLVDVPMHFSEAALPKPAWVGVPYCAFDAVVLYSIIQKEKPMKYLEIGSGITTCFANKAIEDNGLETKIISIDPEPRAQIDDICNSVLRYGLETCDMEIFDSLESGDILFFDGSHRSFMNSDVTVFFIDVLPRIKPGVIIHIHDITLPYDYDKTFKNWYWNEAYLLAVYMMGNAARIHPIAPTAFICKSGLFEDEISKPMIDLGEFNDQWRGGGAMWFTHTS